MCLAACLPLCTEKEEEKGEKLANLSEEYMEFHLIILAPFLIFWGGLVSNIISKRFAEKSITEIR